MDTTSFFSSIQFPPEIYDYKDLSSILDKLETNPVVFSRITKSYGMGIHTIHLGSLDVYYSIESNTDLQDLTFFELKYDDNQYWSEPMIVSNEILLTQTIRKGEQFDLAPPTGILRKMAPASHMNLRYSSKEPHTLKINGCLLSMSMLHELMSNDSLFSVRIGGKHGHIRKGSLVMD
jgi:hypothetical protein